MTLLYPAEPHCKEAPTFNLGNLPMNGRLVKMHVTIEASIVMQSNYIQFVNKMSNETVELRPYALLSALRELCIESNDQSGPSDTIIFKYPENGHILSYLQNTDARFDEYNHIRILYDKNNSHYLVDNINNTKIIISLYETFYIPAVNTISNDADTKVRFVFDTKRFRPILSVNGISICDNSSYMNWNISDVHSLELSDHNQSKHPAVLFHRIDANNDKLLPLQSAGSNYECNITISSAHGMYIFYLDRLNNLSLHPLDELYAPLTKFIIEHNGNTCLQLDNWDQIHKLSKKNGLGASVKEWRGGLGSLVLLRPCDMNLSIDEPKEVTIKFSYKHLYGMNGPCCLHMVPINIGL